MFRQHLPRTSSSLSSDKQSISPTHRPPIIASRLPACLPCPNETRRGLDATQTRQSKEKEASARAARRPPVRSHPRAGRHAGRGSSSAQVHACTYSPCALCLMLGIRWWGVAVLAPNWRTLLLLCSSSVLFQHYSFFFRRTFDGL
ncbi:hypothetical protein BC567DRAFT_95451 [Phyllosticta citribraziliensis]